MLCESLWILGVTTCDMWEYCLNLFTLRVTHRLKVLYGLSTEEDSALGLDSSVTCSLDLLNQIIVKERSVSSPTAGNCWCKGGTSFRGTAPQPCTELPQIHAESQKPIPSVCQASDFVV